MESTITAPIDRSMPAVRMISVCPTASEPTTATCCRMIEMFCGRKKRPLSRPNTMHREDQDDQRAEGRHSGAARRGCAGRGVAGRRISSAVPGASIDLVMAGSASCGSSEVGMRSVAAWQDGARRRPSVSCPSRPARPGRGLAGDAVDGLGGDQVRAGVEEVLASGQRRLRAAPASCRDRRRRPGLAILPGYCAESAAIVTAA